MKVLDFELLPLHVFCLRVVFVACHALLFRLISALFLLMFICL